MAIAGKRGRKDAGTGEALVMVGRAGSSGAVVGKQREAEYGEEDKSWVATFRCVGRALSVAEALFEQLKGCGGIFQ